LINRIINRLGELNRKIEADHKNLGKGYVVGDSFFCPTDPTVGSSNVATSITSVTRSPGRNENSPPAPTGFRSPRKNFVSSNRPRPAVTTRRCRAGHRLQTS
jgi:hypothetical protein